MSGKARGGTSRAGLAGPPSPTRKRMSLGETEERGREQPIGRKLARLAFDGHEIATLESQNEGGLSSSLCLLPLKSGLNGWKKHPLVLLELEDHDPPVELVCSSMKREVIGPTTATSNSLQVGLAGVRDAASF
eukprot:6652063-Alexandrium_andersonii.AAC.1